MNCIRRRNSLQIPLSKDEMDCIRSAAADQQKAAGSTSSSSDAAAVQQNQNTYSSGGATTSSRLHQPFPGCPTNRTGSAPNALHRASTMPATASAGSVRFASCCNAAATTATTPSAGSSGSLLKRALANRVLVQETQNSQARVTPASTNKPTTASSVGDHSAINGTTPHISPTRSVTNTRKDGTPTSPQRRKRAEFFGGDESTPLVGADGALDKGEAGRGASLGSDEMSTSILASAAWYRDATGRTGFQPEEWNWSSVPNLQSSVVKDMRARGQTEGSGGEARRSPSSASLPPIPTTPHHVMRTGQARPRGISSRESSLPVANVPAPTSRLDSDTSKTRGALGNGDYDNLESGGSGVNERVQAVHYDAIAAHIKSVTFSDRVEVNEIEGNFDYEEEESGDEDRVELDLSSLERIMATRPSLLELRDSATQLHSTAQSQSPSGDYDRIGEGSPVHSTNGTRGHRPLSATASRDQPPYVVRSASGYLEANILASLAANQLQEHQQRDLLSTPSRQQPFPPHREVNSKLQQSIYDNLAPSTTFAGGRTRPSGIGAPLAGSPLGSPDSCHSPPPTSSAAETTTEEMWLRAKFLSMYANRRAGEEHKTNQLSGAGNAGTSNPTTGATDQTHPLPKDPFQSPGSPPDEASGGDGGNITATMTGREFERRTSFESVLSSDSRESVVSAASIRAENKVRRYFNY